MAEQDATKPTASAVSFSLLDKTRSEVFQKHFPAYTEGLVRGDPGGFIFTQKYAKIFNDYLNFSPRDDDVWVVTFPKCGKRIALTRPINEIYLG